jgi:hypothetical protein
MNGESSQDDGAYVRPDQNREIIVTRSQKRMDDHVRDVFTAAGYDFDLPSDRKRASDDLRFLGDRRRTREGYRKARAGVVIAVGSAVLTAAVSAIAPGLIEWLALHIPVVTVRPAGK